MAKNTLFTAGQVRLEARLNDTHTAQAVWEALPIAAPAST